MDDGVAVRRQRAPQRDGRIEPGAVLVEKNNLDVLRVLDRAGVWRVEPGQNTE